MNCPKCAHEMKSSQYKDVEYDQCRSCGGLWFDVLEAEELADHKGAADIDTGNAKEGAKMNENWEIKCPTCKVRMLPVQDVEQPHIQLETCPACHGTFFDAGEFKDFCEETFMDRIKDRRVKKHSTH